MYVMGFSSFPPIFSHFGTLNYPTAPNQHRSLGSCPREPANTGSPALPGVLSHIHSKTACRGFESFCPCQKPAETLRFCRFSFYMCCMVMVFTLVQTSFYCTRLHPLSPVSILSSTQNAPGFAFFGLFRVRFPLFCCFSGAKFSCWFLCILSHSVHRLKPSVIPCKREVSFLT